METVSTSILQKTGITMNPTQPLQMKWQPIEDITVYELAKCLPYLFRRPMPWEVDKTQGHFRHFRITDNN